MKKTLTLLLALCLILALCACGSGGSSSAAPTSAPTAAPTAAPTPTAKPTPEPTPEPTPDVETEAAAVIDEARGLFDDEAYYEAALRVRDCQELYPDTEAAEAGNELMDEIAAALKDKEPKTGELERHFPFYGKNCVRATAQSFPFEMTIRDVEDESQFVRFYVRQGDTSEIYLPSSHYHVLIKAGPVWFGDEIGFGELGESSDFGGDTLDMTSGEKNNIISWHEWSPVF